MKVSNWEDKQVTLTEMETRVYTSLKEFSELEDCYCMHPKDLSGETSIPMNQLRGVISSLIKKGVCYVDEMISGCGEWVILYKDV